MSELYHSEEWLRNKYENEKLSYSKIGAICGVTPSTIQKWCKRFNIEARGPSLCHSGSLNGAWIDSPIKDYQWMYHEYVNNKKSMREIATLAGVSLRTIARWIENHSIKVRNTTDYERKKGPESPNWTGKAVCPGCGGKKNRESKRCSECYFSFLRENPKNVPSYKGIVNITQLVREYSKSTWAQKVFERDNYICVECGDSKGGNLNAHHIVPFSIIRDQIIIENLSLFDLQNVDDRLKLVEIMKSDKRMNDLENGVTLCENCHKGEHARILDDLDDSIYRYYADVTRIIDADSVEVSIDLGFGIHLEKTIRLYGLNAYELNSSDMYKKGLALKGKAVLDEICPVGSRISIRTYKADKYGRWLAMLLLPLHEINKVLVESNLAVPYYGCKI